MSETAAEPQATPQDGSLVAAATAFDGILARQKADTQAPAKAQPEQEKAEAKAEPDPKQASAAPESSESEPTKPEVKLWKVKVDADEIEVPEDELLKGYSRTADYTRKTQELAKQRKEWEEGELKASRDLRAQQQSSLADLKTAIEALTPKEPDWNTLRATTSETDYNAKRADWFERKEALDRITAEQARLKSEEEAEATKGFQSWVAEQRTHLARELPEFADPEKGPALQKDLVTFATSRGFAPEEVAQVVDHRVVLLLHDAMVGQKAREAAKQKATEIKTKVEKAIEAATPGTSQPAPKKNAKDDAFSKAAKTGRVEDAAKFFEHLVN